MCRAAFDPSFCYMCTRSDLIGTGSFILTCNIISNGGMPDIVSSFYEKKSYVVTTETMVLGVWNAQGSPTGDTITIPAGTPVRLEGIDVDQELAYFTTLHLDSSENETFNMVITKADWGWHITYDGMNEYTLFIGANYYD